MDALEKAGLSDRTKRRILWEAEQWWEKTGRHLVPKHVNERQDPPAVRTSTGPIFVSRQAVEQDLSDGILRALPWEELKGEEQARIMFQYFANIWLPAHPEVKIERRVH